ncbi:MAG: S-layer homology domain-containing protein, partial [Clostridiaceae bacterium]|nr:S-layer homology domain-containing protein [Clostridiaceae bacterium]
MKLKARILSLILATVLMLIGTGTTAFAANYSDVAEDSSYFQSISLLSALGLLKGYEDNTFKPDGDITRAEFAAVVVRALGQEDTAQSSIGQTQFNDVASDFWGSGYINVATNFGVINGYGDGNFGPQDNVTYEQAVKMVVCALGYEPLALSKVNNDAERVWPGGYLAAAAELNILSGVAGVESQLAKRWQVARLVYNSLDVKLMEKVTSQGQERYVISDTKTLLSDKLDVLYSTGEFYANALETVTESGVRARNGEVIIYDELIRNADKEVVLKDGGLDTQGLIGRKIKFYYTETLDGVKTLLYIENRTDTGNILVIDVADVEDLSGSFESGITINYWKDKEKDTYTTAATVTKNPNIMVNGGAPQEGYDESILQPESGTIELIDTDGNGNYDRVLITAYETYVIKTVNSTSKEIADLYRSSVQASTLKIDEDNANNIISIKRVDGSEITFTNLSKWNVLSVKKGRSGSRDVLDIIVSNNVATGTITGLEDDRLVTISGKTYELSDYYQKYAVNPADKLYIDDSGKFYLDKDGKIAAVEKTAAASSNYGYLLGADYKSGNFQFTILKQTQTAVTTYKGASKVKVDGETYSRDDEFEYFKDIVDSGDYKINVDALAEPTLAVIPDTYLPMLVRYTENSNKEITSLTTVKSDVAESVLDSNKLKMYDLGADYNKKFKYSSGNRTLTGPGGTKIIVNNSTVVFVVPYDRSQTDKYMKKTISYLTNNKSYYVEAYDAEGTIANAKTAKAVVVYESGEIEISSNSPIAIVTSIAAGQGGSDDPDVAFVISGYVYGRGQTGELKESLLASNVLNDVKVGDVILYEMG